MKKRIIIVLVLMLALVLAFVAWRIYEGYRHPASAATSAQAVPSAGKPAKAGPAAIYPDPALTPGDVLTTDASVVCTPGYARTVRHVPKSERLAVFREYGVSFPVPKGSYEVDHHISLELGGSNDIRNLWPEPALPNPGFHEKDVVENYLHSEVCNGHMTLVEAQREISTDWYAVFIRIRRR